MKKVFWKFCGIAMFLALTLVAFSTTVTAIDSEKSSPATIQAPTAQYVSPGYTVVSFLNNMTTGECAFKFTAEPVNLPATFTAITKEYALAVKDGTLVNSKVATGYEPIAQTMTSASEMIMAVNDTGQICISQNVSDNNIMMNLNSVEANLEMVKTNSMLEELIIKKDVTMINNMSSSTMVESANHTSQTIENIKFV